MKAEIKRNNITLPNAVTTAHSNATSVDNVNKASADKDKAKPAKGERKSEVYVVNNGLLLLHPQKVVTSSGVKKSTEPVPPPSINYHVIRKVKNNATDANLAANILENHLKKRSLSVRLRSRHKKKRQNPGAAIAAKRLGIPSTYHGRIISVNKNNRLIHKKLSFFNSNRNKPYKERTNIMKYSNNWKNFGPSDQIRDLLDSIHEQNEKRTGIASPLFDNDQEEYLRSVRHKTSESGHKADKRTKKEAPSRGIAPIKEIPDIRKYFEKPLGFHEYPRFAVRPFPEGEFPRFPISPSALSIYPRFSLSPQNTQILHRFPIHPAPLLRYPRYPYINPVAQFPRFDNGLKRYTEYPRFENALKRYTEYPRFEEIKPLDLEEFPKFPEPKPIPEIKEIGDADKRGKSKRAEIFHRRDYLSSAYVTNRAFYEEGDDEHDNDNDDGDNDDEEEEDEGEEEDDENGRAMGAHAGHSYPLISPIGSISHIQSPPGIPEIADIPFLPDIPPLHGIHGIKPISPIKSIPQSEKTGTSRSLPTEAKDIAKIQSNNVSIKDLSKDQATV